MMIPSIRRVTQALLLGVVLILATQPIIGSAEAQGGKEPNRYKALGITPAVGKWPLNFIPYIYNPTNAPADFSDTAFVEQILADSIAEWAGYCNVQFIYGGVDDTIDIDDSGDGIAVFGWEDIGGAAGQAGPVSTAVSATWGHSLYVDGSLKLNPLVYTSTGSTPGDIINNALSIRETATHELGHLIGLGHSDRPDSIMYANPYNSISHTVQDDIDACRSLYGYSSIYSVPPSYEPPAAGTNNYAQLFITTSADFPNPAPATDDGTYPATDALLIGYANTFEGYDDDLVTVLVDPYGRASFGANAEVVEDPCCIYATGLVPFRHVREIPGLWTIYAYDDTGLLLTATLDVTTTLPVVNDAPEAELTYSEDVSTRMISATTTVTGDTEGDLATINWHIPTVGQTTVSLAASSGSDTQNVALLNDGFDWEIFVDVRDDSARYVEDLPNNVGPAGQGFQTLHRYYASPFDMGPDMNGDNYSDIPWRNSATGQNWLYKMAGNLRIESVHINNVSDTNWNIVSNGDYNKDGKHDMLLRNSVTGQIWMYLMNGEVIETSASIRTISTDWKVAANGDYDGDGKVDILLRNSVTGQLWVWLMDGTTISTSSFVRNLSTNWNVVGSGDYDGDGNCDILIRNSVTGQNWMFLMNGSVIATSSSVNTVSNPDSHVVGNGDYNGDGLSDLLWHNSVSGKLWVYLMNGTIISTFETIAFFGTDWGVAGSGDYNGDSRSDFLLHNYVTGQTWVYFMNGTVSFGNAPVNTVSNLDWEIVNNN